MKKQEPRFEVRSADWLTLKQAQKVILSSAQPLLSEELPVQACLGRSLSQDLVARATLPPWDNSAMDGYAVRGEEISHAGPSTPVVLSVTGVVHAGDLPGSSVGAGEAIRIMTGAPIPPGADSVIRVEDTDSEQTPGIVSVFKNRDERRNIRPAGQDMQLGDQVLVKGTTVTSTTVGLLAALGMGNVPVVKQPSVGILPTGDELRTPERYEDVQRGEGIPESNGPMLAAAVTGASAMPLPLGIASDDPETLRERISEATDADVLITIGGASMGEADLVKEILEEFGFEQDFWRVRIRPGSPFGFGRLPRGDTYQPVFSLPGNPTSAFVTFELFVRPFLLAIGGHKRIFRRTLRCQAAEPLKGPGELSHFLRVRLDSSTVPPKAHITGPQGSGLITTLADAEGLAVVSEHQTEIAEGDSVDVILLADTPGAESYAKSEVSTG